MKLTVTEAAQTKIKNLVAGPAKWLLNLDDGVGNYSREGSCAIDTSFDLIAVNPDVDDPDFNAQMDSDLGPVYYKEYSESYLEQNLKFDVKYNALILSGDSGIVDGNVQIKDLRH